MCSGIYLIQNTVSRLCYIGQSQNVPARWHQHRSILRRGRSSNGRLNRRLAASWALHGESAFQFVLLEECGVDALTERETYWLVEFRDVHGFPVANAEGPVDNAWRGARHRPESLRKIGDATRGVPKSEEHRRKIGAAQKGRTMSAEQRAWLSAIRTGAKCPAMAGEKNPSKREDMRERLRGDKNPACRPESRAKISAAVSRPVVEEMSGRTWPSISRLAEEFGVSTALASAHLAGSKKCTAFAGLRLKKILPA